MNFFVDLQAYPLWQVLGRALLHSLWQGALVAGLLGMALELLRGRGSNVRYAVACAAMALLLLLPALTAWQLVGDTQVVEVGEEAVATSHTVVPGAPVGGGGGVASRRAAASTGRAFVEQSGVTGEGLEKLLPWLTLLWLTGVSLLSARMLCGLVYARRLKTFGVRALGEPFESRAQEISRRLRVTRPVRLLESSLVLVPTAVGWLRPAILLPASALVGLTPRQLEAILIHELAHVRRHDYLINLLQTVVETILFYHPAACWVSRQIRHERELVCDDMVVAATGDALTYARALTKLERLRRPAPGLTLAADGGQLRARVLRLLGAGPRGRRSSTFAIGLVFVAALLTTVACTRAVLSQQESDKARREVARNLPAGAAKSDAVASADVRGARGGVAQTASGEVASLIAADRVEGEDAEVRRVAVEALGRREGTVVVMDPRTGRVFAVVNQEWALRRGWAPASTMKLVTSLAGLDERVFDPAERIRVSGKSERLDLTSALAFSDNEYFRALGPRVGAARILDYGGRLGLGEATGINYVGEYAGRLPSPGSVKSAVNLGFGEGVEVTPVQLAVLVSAVANGGTLLSPSVPRTAEEAAGFAPQPRRRLDVAPDALGQLARGMVAAVERGTGSSIGDPQLKVAGKTGTMVDKRSKGNSAGIFASYAPADDPRLAVVVLLRGEKENGPGAAKVAGSIYRALRGRLSGA